MAEPKDAQALRTAPLSDHRRLEHTDLRKWTPIGAKSLNPVGERNLYAVNHHDVLARSPLLPGPRSRPGWSVSDIAGHLSHGPGQIPDYNGPVNCERELSIAARDHPPCCGKRRGSCPNRRVALAPRQHRQNTNCCQEPQRALSVAFCQQSDPAPVIVFAIAPAIPGPLESVAAGGCARSR